jgi:hypothetical protein
MSEKTTQPLGLSKPLILFKVYQLKVSYSMYKHFIRRL